MLKRYFEKKVEVMGGSSKDNGRCMELEYYLLESDADSSRKDPDQNVFGVEIIMKSDNGEKEHNSVFNCSLCRESALDIVHKLARNSVTPCELHVIIDDMLAD